MTDGIQTAVDEPGQPSFVARVRKVGLKTAQVDAVDIRNEYRRKRRDQARITRHDRRSNDFVDIFELCTDEDIVALA